MRISLVAQLFGEWQEEYQMGRLICVRHGKSAYNALGLWTGHTDVELVAEGREEARRAGEAIRDIHIHVAHTSMLTRTHQTLAEILTTLGRTDLEPTQHCALNERHYGVHTGKNKWEVKDAVGEEEFQRIRRGWDTPIQEGETLKDVHARVVPYFEERIKPDLVAGKNVLVVSHGNTLRALVKHIDGLSEKEIADIEIATGEVHCYSFSEHGAVVDKEIRTTSIEVDVREPAYA